MITNEQVELLKAIEAQGRHRFTNEIVKLGNLVNRHLYDVEINDRGRLAIRGLFVNTQVTVNPTHKHFSLHKGKVGTISAIHYTESFPVAIYPVPYERTTLGWQSRWSHAERLPKSDSPTIQVKFANEPWATWCFYGLDDLNLV